MRCSSRAARATTHARCEQVTAIGMVRIEGVAAADASTRKNAGADVAAKQLEQPLVVDDGSECDQTSKELEQRYERIWVQHAILEAELDCTYSTTADRLSIAVDATAAGAGFRINEIGQVAQERVLFWLGDGRVHGGNDRWDIVAVAQQVLSQGSARGRGRGA